MYCDITMLLVKVDNLIVHIIIRISFDRRGIDDGLRTITKQNTIVPQVGFVVFLLAPGGV